MDWLQRLDSGTVLSNSECPDGTFLSWGLAYQKPNIGSCEHAISWGEQSKVPGMQRWPGLCWWRWKINTGTPI